MRCVVALVALTFVACGRHGFDPMDGNGSGSGSDGGTGDGSMVTPRCAVPARPDVSNPRVTVGCDPIVATQEVLNGGVIRFDCTTGVMLGAPLLVNKDTIIDGNSVVFDGQGITRVFVVNNNARLTLLDVTVTRGRVAADAGGGIVLDNGALVVFDSKFSDNHAAPMNQSGGAISARPNLATVEIYGSRFSSNTAASGGAVYAYENLTIVNSSFDNNSAVGTMAAGTGGDGGAVQFAGSGDVTLCGTTLSSNFAGHQGGALVVISTDMSTVMTMTDVVIDFNSATGAGGAYLQGYSTLTMQRVSVTSNAATAGPAGGLWLQGPAGPFAGENVSIVANRSDGGPGAGLFLGTASGGLAFSTIADNLGNCAGCPAAAIANGANVDLRSTIIVDNASLTTPAVCSETGTLSGATWQWPNDLPLCAAGATVADPLMRPRGAETGPAGSLLVRRPLSGSPVIGAVASACPAEDVLGNLRPTPCAAGAAEP